MWGKKSHTPQAVDPEPKNWQTNQPPKPAPASGEGTTKIYKDVMGPAGATTDRATAWLGSSLHVKGEISGNEDLCIDGTVEGLVHLAWKGRTADQLWLRVLSQIVVAGNAAPGDTLRSSPAVKEKLAFRRLKKLKQKRRREVIHAVLRAIGTRYVGRNVRNRKIDAALHIFDELVRAGGPRQFFAKVAAMKPVEERIKFLSKTLAFYKKKGCRDILIDLRLATDCLALDRRLNRIVECLGAKVPRSLNRHYEEALIDRRIDCGSAGDANTSGRLRRDCAANSEWRNAQGEEERLV